MIAKPTFLWGARAAVRASLARLLPHRLDARKDAAMQLSRLSGYPPTSGAASPFSASENLGKREIVEENAASAGKG